MHFFCTAATFYFPTEGLFSRALGCGTRRGQGACTLHASLTSGRAPWPALWAFKVATSWLFSLDRFPSSQSQASPWKTNTVQLVFLFFTVLSLCCCSLKHHSSPQRLGNHDTAAAALQAFPFVAATNCASACVCVCVRVRVRVRACACFCVSSTQSEPETLSRREAQFQLFSVIFLYAALTAVAVYLYQTVRFGRCGSHGTTAAVYPKVFFLWQLRTVIVYAWVRG